MRRDAAYARNAADQVMVRFSADSEEESMEQGRKDVNMALGVMVALVALAFLLMLVG
jgi:hypothetical protein